MRTFSVTLLLIFLGSFVSTLSAQPIVSPGSFPKLKKAKIKRGTVVLKNAEKVQGYIYDINETHLIYFEERKHLELALIKKCKGCDEIPIEKVARVSFQKLDGWGQSTSALAAMVVGGSLALSAGGEGEFKYLAIVLLGAPAGTVLAGNLLTAGARKKTRSITTDQLETDQYERQHRYILKKAVDEVVVSRKNYFKKLDRYITAHPSKDLRVYSFGLAAEEPIVGYFVKEEDGFYHLSTNKETVKQFRSNRVDTPLKVKIDDVEFISLANRF